jgi:hypothetical protein
MSSVTSTFSSSISQSDVLSSSSSNTLPALDQEWVELQ